MRNAVEKGHADRNGERKQQGAEDAFAERITESPQRQPLIGGGVRDSRERCSQAERLRGAGVLRTGFILLELRHDVSPLGRRSVSVLVGAALIVYPAQRRIPSKLATPMELKTRVDQA